jgi:hypothetical protein
MAFREYTKRDLESAIREGKLDEKRPAINLVRHATVGIKSLHFQIEGASKLPVAVVKSSAVADAKGRLVPGKSIPLLIRRYKITELIGEGTFSVILKAVDIYSNREVAIKAMNVGLKALGYRECCFLRHLASATAKEHKRCKSLFDLVTYFLFIALTAYNFRHCRIDSYSGAEHLLLWRPLLHCNGALWPHVGESVEDARTPRSRC